MKPVKLDKRVARKYRLGTHHTRIVHPRFGEIDLRTITLEKANEYVAAGNFPYLVRKPKPVPRKMN
ncbi:hypothetical protein [Pontibacter beigongshangensis]|uniref:hypothetical protein n=1 Tax=Pontibacter beigongshangensis TaxID=2574733 RepID=UPI001650BD80|nr:hypothetical protein [Pontibacter beigongshangensis]